MDFAFGTIIVGIECPINKPGNNMAEEKEKKFFTTVVIDNERCKGCSFCVEFCPSKALKSSEQYNSKGYHPPVLISKELCSGCDMCGLLCPDFAIYGIRIRRKNNEAA